MNFSKEFGAVTSSWGGLDCKNEKEKMDHFGMF